MPSINRPWQCTNTVSCKWSIIQLKSYLSEFSQYPHSFYIFYAFLLNKLTFLPCISSCFFLYLPPYLQKWVFLVDSKCRNTCHSYRIDLYFIPEINEQQCGKITDWGSIIGRKNGTNNRPWKLEANPNTNYHPRNKLHHILTYYTLWNSSKAHKRRDSDNLLNFGKKKPKWLPVWSDRKLWIRLSSRSKNHSVWLYSESPVKPFCNWEIRDLRCQRFPLVCAPLWCLAQNTVKTPPNHNATIYIYIWYIYLSQLCCAMVEFTVGKQGIDRVPRYTKNFNIWKLLSL